MIIVISLSAAVITRRADVEREAMSRCAAFPDIRGPWAGLEAVQLAAKLGDAKMFELIMRSRQV